jgi:hypothetical protein
MTPDFAEWLLQTPESERTGRVFKIPSLRDGQPMGRATVGMMIKRIGKKAGVVVARAPTPARRSTPRPMTYAVASGPGGPNGYGPRYSKG